MPSCTYPDCQHTARASGLCEGHYKQQRRGQELRPLHEKMEVIGRLRVSRDAADALERAGAKSRLAAARLVIEAWAMRGK